MRGENSDIEKRKALSEPKNILAALVLWNLESNGAGDLTRG